MNYQLYNPMLPTVDYSILSLPCSISNISPVYYGRFFVPHKFAKIMHILKSVAENYF